MPDRYSDADPIPHTCRDGWLTPEDADVQIPCPEHRKPAQGAGVNYGPTNLSERARAAIERDEQR